VPQVYEDLSTHRVLVQERLPGNPLGDDPSVAERIDDRYALADDLLQSFLHQMLVDGLFHADPHPGNVFVLGEGRIGLIDFGAAGVLDSITRDALKQMVLAVTLRDAHLLRQSVAQVTTVSPDIDTDALERALAHFMATNIQPGAGISPSAINDLTPLFREYGIELPVGLTTFSRTFVILEGTLRQLAPGYSLSDGIQKLARSWQEETIGDKTLEDLATEELIAALPSLRQLPRQLDDLSNQLTHGQFTARVRLFASDADNRFLQRLVNRAVMAFIGAVAIAVSAALIITDAGPAFSGEATMLNLFGYLGLFGGSVLLLRVLTAVVRDGLN
jgi:ubiquinone biosynthesis protein